MRPKRENQFLNQDSTILGSRIREARERAGYKTPGELANAIRERGGEITRQHIRHIEIGKGTPSLKTLTMILDACGVSTSDFLGTDITLKEDASILGARIREARERAGYKTSGQLWKAIQERGGNITRQYIYQLERGKRTASLSKLTVILDACGMTMSDFLGTDLIIGPRGDTDIEQRKLVSMLTKVREVNPALARVIESAIIRAHNEVLQQSKDSSVKHTTPRNPSGRFTPKKG